MDDSSSSDFDIVNHDDANPDGPLKPEPPEVLVRLQSWLKPTDYNAESSEFNRHLASHVDGTGAWVQDSEAYKAWLDDRNPGALWIKGIAGAGKSVVAANIAHGLSKIERDDGLKVPMLTFFFRQIVATNHSAHNLVRDWISQALGHSPALQKKIKGYMDERMAVEGLGLKGLWNDLVSGIEGLEEVYCIIDALDEMDDDQEEFLRDLVELGKLKPKNIKVLMTSRPLPRIEAALKDPSLRQMRLEESQVDGDIAMYIDHRLYHEGSLDDGLNYAIKQAIGAKSQGSFLYARLMMDKLLDPETARTLDTGNLHRYLALLPISLEDVYNCMLHEHSTRSGVPQKLQETILTWVTFSTRPLRLLELASILDFLQPRSGNEHCRDTKANVRAACGPLLEILEDETVSIIHHSFIEFLRDGERIHRSSGVHEQFPFMDFNLAHNSLASACLDYLLSGCLDSMDLPAPPDPNSRRDMSLWHFNNKDEDGISVVKLQHSFLDYAANNWYVHVRNIGVRDVVSKIERLTNADNSTLAAWLYIVGSKSLPAVRGFTPLHVAAWTGLEQYVEHGLVEGLDCNALDQHECNPLVWAAKRGHDKVVELLLKHAADPDKDDFRGMKPLHYAATANHHKVVRLLLEAGVDLMTKRTRDYPPRQCGNMPSSIGETPLQYACESASIESIREMMPYVDADGLFKAAGWATNGKSIEVLDLLLTSPDIYLDTPKGSPVSKTPLFLAASRHRADMVRSLLKNGANPNGRSVNPDHERLPFHLSDLRRERIYPTPMHALAGARYRPNNEEDLKICFHLLLDAGADVNAVNNSGLTPLHLCVNRSPALGLVELLLNSGADPMARDKDGNTPLHLVQFTSKSSSAIQLLLRHGADVTARRADGSTPLHTAADGIVFFDLAPIEAIFDWNVPDINGNTPLHRALNNSCGKQKAAEVLLKAGADPNRKNHAGETPLHLVIGRYPDSKRPTLIRLLLDAGADLEAPDNSGQTLFLRIVGNNTFKSDGLLDLVKYVLESGANLQVQDYNGNNALHLACRKSKDPKLIDFLVNAGLNPLCVNHSGETLVHELAKCGVRNPKSFEKTFTTLLDRGLSFQTQDNRGRTPFHVICGVEPQNSRDWKDKSNKHPFCRLFKLVEGAGLDIPDHHGIRPIHIAATFYEDLVDTLLGRIDGVTSTHEGRNLLHIAARSRQCNIVGLVLDHYREIGRLDLTESQDVNGRTPLHDASRSGIPESVTLLLKAGANIHAKDKCGKTPLHVCAEIKEEEILWDMAKKLKTEESIYGRGILLSDTTRPLNRKDGGGRAKVRDVIRVLLLHGADPKVSADRNMAPIDLALEEGCERMLSEFMQLHDNDKASHEDDISSSGYLPKQTKNSIRAKHVRNLLKGVVRPDKDNLELCNELLKSEAYEAIEQLISLGVDFLSWEKPRWHGAQLFLQKLAQCGYSSLFEAIGDTIQEPSWINGLKKPDETDPRRRAVFILDAARRELPNLDMIKLIIEKYNADLNLEGESPLHILAAAKHWWQADAIRYLLQHGADPNLKNDSKNGRTALHIAASQRDSIDGHLRKKVVGILLEHGANPNVMDYEGFTCVSYAAHDMDLVTTLFMSHGADLNLGNGSLLFSAIEKQDVPFVRTLLEAGVDCNIRRTEGPKEWHYGRANLLYPLAHAVASMSKESVKIETAMEIIKLLLCKGADAYKNTHGGSTIIHDTFERVAIVNPFLEQPNLDLERRGKDGRTLLLSACSSGCRLQPTCCKNPEEHKPDAPTVALTLYRRGADLSAVDDRGSNALHFLLGCRNIRDNSHVETFAVFAKEGGIALVKQMNSDGKQPLHYALTREPYCQILLDAGADPLATDAYGNTALHLLANKNCANTPFFKQFLALGVDINAKNKNGETALFRYFSVNPKREYSGKLTDEHRQNFGPFVEARADVFATNNEGETLLHATAKRRPGSMLDINNTTAEILDSFKFLMELGLDPMTEDNNQRTAVVSSGI